MTKLQISDINMRNSYISLLTINFNKNICYDSDAIFRIFFTNGYDSENAICVQDSMGLPMWGLIYGIRSKIFTYSFDTNIQRGFGSESTDVPITVVACGKNTAQYIKINGIITRSKSNIIYVNSPDSILML